MSMQEKFEKKLGKYFVVEDWPEYVITIDPPRIMALIDTTKFNKVQHWEPFNIEISFDEGYVTYEDESYNVIYIKEIIDILRPNEYGVYQEHIVEKNEDGWILVLKRGDFAILLAPSVKIDATSDRPEIALKDILKKAPSSVMVL